MAPRPIIIDTDPGQDDAIAILLALASPELEVRAVTAVAGNVPLPLTERNARALVELAGRPEVPVAAGCARPLVRPLVTAEQVHGKTGLDGADLPDPTIPLDRRHAVDLIVEEAMAAAPGDLTLCVLGPLTNIAMAMVKEPRIVPRLARIVLMGGGFFEGGNTTPTSEFNIYVDPHAAMTVFDSGVPLVVAPLDVTHRALMPRAWIDGLGALGTATGRACQGMLTFYERFDIDRYGQDGGPLHDPCVIAWMLDPTLFRGREVNVRVETGSELTMGMTVVDWWGQTGLPANGLWLRDVDAPRFFGLLHDRLATLP
jgi:purine nucleosidase